MYKINTYNVLVSGYYLFSLKSAMQLLIKAKSKYTSMKNKHEFKNTGTIDGFY